MRLGISWIPPALPTGPPSASTIAGQTRRAYPAISPDS